VPVESAKIMPCPELFHYLFFLFKSRSGFDLHSPFVYTLYSKVLRVQNEYPGYIQAETLFPGINQKKYYRLLFRLSAWFKPKTICFYGREESREKAYLHSGYPESSIINFESNPEGTVDLVFMDLEFIKDPLNKSFSSLRQHISGETVFIIWSVDDPGALSDNWKAIQDLPGVTLTINLFRTGLVFFNENLSREDFRLRF
jgi:hypothetical protein